MLIFFSEAYFSQLRFFNEPEISGPSLKVRPGGHSQIIRYKNKSQSLSNQVFIKWIGSQQIKTKTFGPENITKMIYDRAQIEFIVLK